MIKRLISSVIAFPIFIFFLYMGGQYLTAATFVVILIMLYEFFHATRSLTWPSAIGGILSAAYLYRFGFDHYELFLTGMMFLLLLGSLKSPKLDMRLIGLFLTSVFYITVPIYLLDLVARSEVPRMVWLVFIIAWVSDTSAYFVGRAFGKTPLAPRISPKKTVAGSIGGVAGAVAASLVFYWFIGLDAIVHPMVFTLMMIGASILSQLGDLIASSIKRAFGIKDFGQIMPGHGGLLDRFDSVIILIPLIYGYIAYF